MAAPVSVQFAGTTDYATGLNKSLISSSIFNNEFYTYTVTRSRETGVKIGTFTLVSGATASTCPIGRVVHLTGRKLYANINPMNTFVVGSPLQTPKFLVSIYDPISFLNGFIDPTSTTFASYDQNLPNFFDLGTQGSGVLPPLGGKGGGTSTFKLADPFPSALLGSSNTLNVGDATMGQLKYNDQDGYITLLSSAIKSNSIILITLLLTNSSTTTTYRSYLSNQATGTVRINWIGNGTGSSGQGYLNYLILNA
uniref:Uncharacterized protein n=1 Tax=viral metagenome TaxID=1070528 RepID=A0A6C0K6P8_9ZZZZ